MIQKYRAEATKLDVFYLIFWEFPDLGKVIR